MSKRLSAVWMLVAAIFTGAAAADDCPQPAVLGSAKNIAIDAAVTRHRLPFDGDALGSKTELVLRGIRFDAHPGTQFNVVLERADDRSKRVKVGMLSFYTSSKAPRTFDVTDELRQLAASKSGLRSVNVVFEATSGRGGAGAKAYFDPDSKLTVGELELRVKAK